jgi:glutaminyl-tRNA synthetase
VHANARAIANWVANEVLRELKGRSLGDLPFTAVDLAHLVKLVDQRVITNASAKQAFAVMLGEGGDPIAIVGRLGLDKSLSEDALAAAVDQVLATLPGKVDEYRAGKVSLLGMFTGQVMKATGGKASPQTVQTLLKQRLDATPSNSGNDHA